MPRKIGRPPARPAVTTKEPGPTTKAKPTGKLNPTGKTGVRSPVKKQGPTRTAPPSRDTFAPKASRPPANKQVASARPALPASPRRPKPGPGPVPKAAVTASEVGVLTRAAAGNLLGASVAKSAQALKGKLHWTLPAVNEKGIQNDFETFVKTGKAMDSDSSMNCWEAVLFAGMEAGLLPADSMQKAFNDNIYTDFQYNAQITDWMCGDNPTPYNSPKDAKPGDIILFYGTAHVAVSLGGDRVMSLWNGPNGDTTFQETTISALNAKVQSDDALLMASLKASLADGSYTGSMDAAAVEELVYNYSDLLDFDDPEFPDETRSSAEDLAEARAAMMEAVSDFNGVQVARAPWKRIQNLAEKTREY